MANAKAPSIARGFFLLMPHVFTTKDLINKHLTQLKFSSIFDKTTKIFIKYYSIFDESPLLFFINTYLFILTYNQLFIC